MQTDILRKTGKATNFSLGTASFKDYLNFQRERWFSQNLREMPQIVLAEILIPFTKAVFDVVSKPILLLLIIILTILNTISLGYVMAPYYYFRHRKYVNDIKDVPEEDILDWVRREESKN